HRIDADGHRLGARCGLLGARPPGATAHPGAARARASVGRRARPAVRHVAARDLAAPARTRGCAPGQAAPSLARVRDEPRPAPARAREPPPRTLPAVLGGHARRAGRVRGARVVSEPLIVRRVIRAPVERVFAAWTEPAHLVRWWGPAPVVCCGAEVDLRVGG